MVWGDAVEVIGWFEGGIVVDEELGTAFEGVEEYTSEEDLSSATSFKGSN